MKLPFLLWFFFNLCGRALSSTAFEGTTGHEDFKQSRPILQALVQVHGLNGTRGLLGEDGSRGYKAAGHEMLHSIKKGQKGKGSYGGANLVHRPRPDQKSGAFFSVAHCFETTITLLSATLILILIVPSLSLL